jgi:ribosomal protein S25
MTAIQTPPAGSNGHAEPLDFGDLRTLAERLDRELAEEATTMRRMLEAEQRLRAQVEVVLDTISTREKRLQRALAALEGTAAGPGRPKAQKAQAAAAKHGSSWSIGEDKIERAHAALVELGEARTSQIAKKAGISTETARRAVRALRERERARIVKHDKNLGDYYALMPDAAEEQRDAA